MSDVFHHFYSSMRGYTTLFMSAEIRPLKDKLEKYARAMAGNITDGLLMNTFTCESFRFFSRVFNAGVDGFRRKRYAIHSFGIPVGQLSRFPGFTPFSVGVKSFLDKSADFQNLDDSSFPELVLSKEMCESKFRSLSVENISFTGASQIYRAFISAPQRKGVLYLVLNTMKDIVKLDKVLSLVPRKVRDTFNFYFNYDGSEVPAEGVYVSMQPSWENKKLDVGDNIYVNLCTGESANTGVTDMDETITVENLWGEKDPGKRAANLENVKNFVRRQEMNILVE